MEKRRRSIVLTIPPDSSVHSPLVIKTAPRCSQTPSSETRTRHLDRARWSRSPTRTAGRKSEAVKSTLLSWCAGFSPQHSLCTSTMKLPLIIQRILRIATIGRWHNAFLARQDPGLKAPDHTAVLPSQSPLQTTQRKRSTKGSWCPSAFLLFDRSHHCCKGALLAGFFSGALSITEQ